MQPYSYRAVAIRVQVSLSPWLLLRACDELRPTILDTVRVGAARALVTLKPGPGPSTSTSLGPSPNPTLKSEPDPRSDPNPRQVPALLEALLPLDHAEAAPLRRCAAVLYGGSALGAAAAATYRALGVTPLVK